MYFVIPKLVQLHVGNILNQKAQYIAMAYIDNQHLWGPVFTMEKLAFHTINTFVADEVWSQCEQTIVRLQFM